MHGERAQRVLTRVHVSTSAWQRVGTSAWQHVATLTHQHAGSRLHQHIAPAYSHIRRLTSTPANASHQHTSAPTHTNAHQRQPTQTNAHKRTPTHYSSTPAPQGVCVHELVGVCVLLLGDGGGQTSKKKSSGWVPSARGTGERTAAEASDERFWHGGYESAKRSARWPQRNARHGTARGVRCPAGSIKRNCEQPLPNMQRRGV